MSDRNLVLVLSAEQSYLRNIEGDENETICYDSLFAAITETYIPLLNMFSRLESDGIPFKLCMVLPPILCTLLKDSKIQSLYVSYLDKMIFLGDEELERTRANPELLQNVRLCLKKIQKAKIDFIDTYKSDLVKAFKDFSDRGFIEIIPTTATPCYLPHFNDLQPALAAQIETGLHAHRVFFGSTGDGFYLPFFGWSDNLESTLRSYGVNYTILDTKSILFAENATETGIFSPLRTRRSLVLFGRDWDTPEDIVGARRGEGFASAMVYRNQQRDIGYELGEQDLKACFDSSNARYQTGFKYWANEAGCIYNEAEAKKQTEKDAHTFYESKKTKLNTAQESLGDKETVLVCNIPCELLGTTWYEGIDWLDKVIRLCDEKKEITLSVLKKHIENQFSLPKIVPYPCSSEGDGYGESLLDNTNNWMIKYTRMASERMIDLTERFPAETGIKARLLNIAAREVLLAQSGDWQKKVHDGNLSDFATKTFTHNIQSFSAIFESLASNTVSTEWLCNLEKEDNIFPWINYRVFSAKK